MALDEYIHTQKTDQKLLSTGGGGTFFYVRGTSLFVVSRGEGQSGQKLKKKFQFEEKTYCLASGSNEKISKNVDFILISCNCIQRPHLKLHFFQF